MPAHRAAHQAVPRRVQRVEVEAQAQPTYGPVCPGPKFIVLGPCLGRALLGRASGPHGLRAIWPTIDAHSIEHHHQESGMAIYGGRLSFHSMEGTPDVPVLQGQCQPIGRKPARPVPGRLPLHSEACM